MNKSQAEQETTITYDREENLVRVFSAIRKDQRKLSKANIKPYKGTEKLGFFYKLPLDRFKWGVRRHTKKVLSPEHKAKLIDSRHRKGIPEPVPSSQ